MNYKLVPILLIPFLSLSAHADRPLIIGGQTVSASDWIAHSVVAFVATNAESQALCTASIVANDLAITAAHCISDQGSDPVKSAAGTNYTLIFKTTLQGAAQSDLRQVDGVEIPSEWDPSSNSDSNTSDVAVVHFSGGLPTGYEISDLLPFNETLTVGENVELAGYGISNATADTGAGILRKTTVTITNPNYSSSEVELDQTHGGGACHGDSGGPAYVLIDNHPYLFGITSRGGGNCDETVIYTKISAYADWFKKASDTLRNKFK
ncbi:unnamed protein product [Sphagnum jensenii]